MSGKEVRNNYGATKNLFEEHKRQLEEKKKQDEELDRETLNEIIAEIEQDAAAASQPKGNL